SRSWAASSARSCRWRRPNRCRSPLSRRRRRTRRSMDRSAAISARRWRRRACIFSPLPASITACDRSRPSTARSRNRPAGQRCGARNRVQRGRPGGVPRAPSRRLRDLEGQARQHVLGIARGRGRQTGLTGTCGAVIARARGFCTVLPAASKLAERSRTMSKLKLSVAVGNYDRVRPLMDGAVQIDGVDPVFMNLPPEEIFFRAFRGMDFDICELSMSSFTVKTAERNCPYVGVPAFVSRAFRHNSIYVRKDRVKSPADLKGRRVGLPEYQLTACVWARIILEDDHGVKPSDMVWVRGGIEHPGRPEKIAIKLPPGVRMEDAPSGVTISELLERGDIDGFIAPRVPSLAGKKNP